MLLAADDKDMDVHEKAKGGWDDGMIDLNRKRPILGIVRVVEPGQFLVAACSIWL